MKTWKTVGVSIPVQVYKLLDLKAVKLGVTKHALMVEAIASFALTENPSTTDNISG